MDLTDIKNFNNIKKVLIVTKIDESINNNHIHYSAIKGLLLAKGLSNLNYTVFIASSDDGILLHNNFYFINFKLLTVDLLSSFDMVFFNLFNPEILTPLYNLTNIFNNLNDAKQINKNLKIIFKSCLYPIVLNELGLDSYNFFDKIFVQTEKIKLPKLICNQIGYDNVNLSVENLNKFCNDHNKISKINYSEMTFDTPDLSNKHKEVFKVNKNTINLIYLGRLMECNGMIIIYLIKLMKRLGSKYKLYIIPGSFKLPDSYPSKKKSATRPHQFLELKNFLENYKLDFNEKYKNVCKPENYTDEIDDCSECNIELLPQFNYGEHFQVIKQMDLALGMFLTGKHTEGSAKLFDYMCSNVRIVSETGWHNMKYIEQYNFGKCLQNGSTVKDTVEVIKEVLQMDKNEIKYEQFINDHNCIERCRQLLDKLN